jgi:hypothetical protein
VLIIPLQTLPRLRISFRKKAALLGLFGIGSLAIISSIIRCIVSLTNSDSPITIIMWSAIEEAMTLTVANIPILRPLLFSGKDFQTNPSGSGSLGDFGNRSRSGGRMHDIYEMTSDKAVNGVVGVVSAGNGNYSNTSTITSSVSHHHPSSMGSNAQDTIGVVRTVQVVVESVDIQQQQTRNGDASSSKSSFALL